MINNKNKNVLPASVAV